MESQSVKDVIKILEGAFVKNEPVLLHELLWSIDARHYLILNSDEINSAIDFIGGIKKMVDGNEVKLTQLKAEKSDYINNKDIERAMKVYNKLIKKLKFK